MPGVAEVTYQLYINEDVFFNVNDLGSKRDGEKSENMQTTNSNTAYLTPNQNYIP